MMRYPSLCCANPKLKLMWWVPVTHSVRTGIVRAGYLGRDRIRASITRADIATFLLDQTTAPRFHRAAPAISN